MATVLSARSERNQTQTLSSKGHESMGVDGTEIFDVNRIKKECFRACNRKRNSSVTQAHAHIRVSQCMITNEHIPSLHRACTLFRKEQVPEDME